MEATVVPNWSALPGDLLGIIAMHALKSSADDFMAFRGVCSSWRSVATNDKRVANYSKSWPSLPYLMLKGENGKHERQLYSLSKRKICRRFSLPEICGNRCIEARFGWLLLFTVGNSLETKLFNPFTRAQIELPNLKTPARNSFLCHTPSDFTFRAVLSKNPAEHSQFVLVVLAYNGLVFWRNGDQIWTMINFPVSKDVNYYPASSVRVKDVNYSDRDQRFYAIGDNGNIWGWDGSAACTALELMFCVFRRDVTLYFKSVQAYVMESSSPCIGELLLVTRNYSTPSIEKNFAETTDFKVFKFDVETVGKTRVEEIKRLENEAIFVGTNAAVCIPSSGAIEPDCVYFSDGCAYVEDEDEEKPANYFQPRNDMGVYHLQKESIERFDEAIQKLGFLSPPLWIAPSYIS